MKLQIALSLIAIILFSNNIYAESLEASTCKSALEKGDVSLALKQAAAALQHDSKEVAALICQGRALAASDKLDAALASFKLADSFSDDAFDKTIASLLMGRTYHTLNQTDAAIASFKQTILNAQAANNQAFERIGHNAVGDVYVANKQLEQALPDYMAGSKLALNDNERGESYEKIALTHHNMQHHDLALEYQIKAYLMHEMAGTLDQYAHSSIELGRYYVLTKNYTSAENTLNKIIKFAQEQGGAYYEAQGRCVLAQVKAAKGDMPAAKALIAQAKSIASNIHDKALAAEIDHETAEFM